MTDGFPRYSLGSRMMESPVSSIKSSQRQQPHFDYHKLKAILWHPTETDIKKLGSLWMIINVPNQRQVNGEFITDKRT